MCGRDAIVIMREKLPWSLEFGVLDFSEIFICFCLLKSCVPPYWAEKPHPLFSVYLTHRKAR